MKIKYMIKEHHRMEGEIDVVMSENIGLGGMNPSTHKRRAVLKKAELWARRLSEKLEKISRTDSRTNNSYRSLLRLLHGIENMVEESFDQEPQLMMRLRIRRLLLEVHKYDISRKTTNERAT